MTPLERYDEAVKIYLDNLSHTAPSQKTLINYKRRTRLFRGFWSARHGYEPSKDPQTSDVIAWRDSMADGGLKPSTINQYLQELALFFRTMADPEMGDCRFYTENPVSKRLFLKPPQKEAYIIPLTDEQIKLLFVNKPTAGAWRDLWARNYALIVTLLCTGLRREEILSLTPADVDFQYSEFTVKHGKGDKKRVVDVPEAAMVAIKLYVLSEYRPLDTPDTEPLFGALTDGVWHKMTGSNLAEVVERHVRAVTGVKGVRTHMLRHIYARLNLNTGTSREILQGQLGHANAQTTEIYSDRVMQRRGRESALSVLAARDAETEKNKNLLKEYGITDTEQNMIG